MTTKVSTKINLSSMQVLKTLKVMLQDDYTMNQIIEKLNTNEKTPIFNNSIISKYINTCRYCGITISKIDTKYFVTNTPFGFELNGEDIYLLDILAGIVKNNMSKKDISFFDSFIDKLNRCSKRKIAKVNQNDNSKIIGYFEQALEDKRKIRLIKKNHSAIDCIPVSIVQNRDKFFFHVLFKDKEKVIDFKKVDGIEVLSEKFVKEFKEPVVVFKLKGSLALRYTLREHERLVEMYDGESITVSNSGENKEVLMARLLRYDDKCEVTNPKSFREEMFNTINSALKNYGE